MQDLVLIQTYIKNCKKCNHVYLTKATAQPGTDARVRVFSAGLLARSQFASGRSCDGELDQGLSWFSLVPEQMLSWYPNSTLLCSACFTCSPPDGNFKIFRPNAAR
jgi:hypothetical protein